MIHHSLTKDSGTVSWDDIERYHRSKRFVDIGYHYGVEGVDGSYQAFVGRAEQDHAAACFEDGMNRRAVHICCVGNFDIIEPPAEMLDLLVRRLIIPIRDRYSMFNYGIVFHRQYAPYKSCPGTKFTREMILERL